MSPIHLNFIISKDLHTQSPPNLHDLLFPFMKKTLKSSSEIHLLFLFYCYFQILVLLTLRFKKCIDQCLISYLAGSKLGMVSI